MESSELHIEDIKKIQLNILKSFASFCEAKGLNYYLAYGTLIGAIRHKGYIPWDDDVDVIMPRPDYLRFIKEYKDERYVVFCPENDKDCPFSYGKLYDNKTLLDENTSRKYNIGLNIDIFVLDGMPDHEEEAKKHIKNCSFWIEILEIKKIAHSKKRSLAKSAFLSALKTLVFPFPYNWVRNRLIKLNQKYDFEQSHYCSDLCYTEALYLSKDIFGKGKKVLFEDSEFIVPSDYDSWLRGVYGDYMELPPESQRVTHHSFKAYLK